MKTASSISTKSTRCTTCGCTHESVAATRCTVPLSVKLAADGVLRGAEMMRAFMVSTLTDLVLRVALAVFLSGGMGTLGVWSAWPIGWCVATGLSLLFYLRKFKKQPVAA